MRREVFYYVHGESGCAFLSFETPDVVIGQCGDGCADEVDRECYERACEEFGLIPVDEDEFRIFGDLL